MPRNDVKGGARWIFGVGERQAAVDSGKGDIASRTNTDPNQRTG